MAIIEGKQGPLLDGRPYHTPEFLQNAEAYHSEVAAAHAGHSKVSVPLPSLLPMLAAEGGTGDGEVPARPDTGNGEVQPPAAEAQGNGEVRRPAPTAHGDTSAGAVSEPQAETRVRKPRLRKPKQGSPE